jgi:putative SOS response-associated peptidase YedK
MPREELRALRRLQRDQGPVTRDGAYWWSKPLKELRMATFNARAEAVETKPVFRDALKRTRCLIPMSGYYETPSQKAALVLHGSLATRRG